MSVADRLRSLSLKVMLSVVVVVAVAALLVANRLGAEARARLIESKASAVAMLADLLAESLAPAVDFEDAESVKAGLQHLQRNRDLTYAGVWGRAGAAPISEVGRRARDLGRPESRSRVEIGAQRIRVVRVLVDPSAEPIGVVLAEFTLAPENARIGETRREILRDAWLLALGVSGVVFAVMGLQVIRPLHRLVLASDELARGAESRVAVTSRDEIGLLGRAFNSMAEAIADREARLAQANRELEQLLHNMRQAIVVFGRDGVLEGFRSRQVDKLFAKEALQHGNVRELLYPGQAGSVELEAFDAWQSAVFEAPTDAWQELIEFAPQKVALRDNTAHERVLSLEFIPIVVGDSLRQIMLLATDVSDELRLERMVRKQDEEHARQLAAMRRLLAGGGHLVVATLDAARERVDGVKRELSQGSLDLPTIEGIFRQIHTVKGEARAFDLAELDAAGTSLEDYLALLRSRLQNHEASPGAADLEILRERLASVERAIGSASVLLTQASPIGAAILEQVTVRRPDLAKVLELAGESRTALGDAVRRLAARPFGEALLYLTEAVPNWGLRYGKQIALEVSGRKVPIPMSLSRVLPSVMTHLARNAVAHGIESVAERVALGKPPQGRLSVDAREVGAGVEITFADDGRGLDRSAISAVAARLGVGGAAEDLVFVAGLSTSGVTALSGRGVGLGAVRQDLAGAGYAIEVSTQSPGTRFRIFVAAEPMRATLSG